MNSIFFTIQDLLVSNGLVTSFLFVGILTAITAWLSKHVFRNRLHSSGIAIAVALILAGVVGYFTGGSKGVSDLEIFSGVGVLGGSMFRDFAIVSTVYGASLLQFKKCGLVGIASLIIGILASYVVGVAVAFGFGYTDPVSLATIGAGTATFIVGPVTGAALGADSAVIAISIAAGLVKSIAVMIVTPLVAKPVGLTTPKAAMIYGGLMGTTSGTAAGLAATDQRLVPYGAMTATFYTGLGCLLCPSVLYGITAMIF